MKSIDFFDRTFYPSGLSYSLIMSTGIETDLALLRSNAGPYADMLSGDNSFYLPSVTPEILSMALAAGTRVEVTPRSSINTWGTTTIFEINQQLPEIARFTVNLTVSPITHNGTYLYWCENWLQQIFQYIRYKDNNFGQLIIYTPEDLIDEFRLLPITEQEHVADQYQLGLTQAQRSTLAAAGFTANFPLPSWICERPSHLLRAQMLACPMTIELAIPALNTLINTDATTVAGGTITITLTYVGRISTPAERNITAAVINTDVGTTMQVRNYFYYEIGRIPAGTTSITFQIDVIKGPVRALDLFFRAWNDVHGSTLTPIQNEYTRFLPQYKPDYLEIKSGTQYMVQRIATRIINRDNRAYLHSRSHPEYMGGLVRIDMADRPDDDLKYNSGYLDFNFAGVPVVNLWFNSATTQDISFGILAKTTGWLNHTRGNIRPISNN